MTLYVGAILLAAIVSVGLHYWVKARQEDIACYAVCQDKFFVFANRLADDESVPLPVLEAIGSLGRILPVKGTIRHYLLIATLGMVKANSQHPTEAVKQFHEALKALSPSQTNLLAQAMMHGVVALTYNSMIAGRFARNVLLVSISPRKSLPKPPKFDPQVTAVFDTILRRDTSPHGALSG
jgi:hypothetical protein